MEIKKMLIKDIHGRQCLRQWRTYYTDLYSSNRYKWIKDKHCPVYFEGEYIFIYDSERHVIWESRRKICDMELFGDIVEDVKGIYMGYPDDRMPWFQIGMEAAKRFRLYKQDEIREEEQRIEREVKRKVEAELSKTPSFIHTRHKGLDWVNMGLEIKDGVPLWLSLWREHEICFLFADSNIGKSIYALQMAFDIAKYQKVLYFDYEMSCKDFQRRYSGLDGSRYPIPDNFVRCEPNRKIFLNPRVEELIINDMEKLVEEEHAKIIIIDNLTFISKNSQSASAVAMLMYQLKILQEKHDLSILILAHTPKRNLHMPITQNDLAGSKKLFNFADSGFAIGQSITDLNLQYIKQLKTRSGKIEYGADNVILIERVFSDNWLHFETIGFDDERNHLKESRDDYVKRMLKEISKLEKFGMSQRDMAKILKTSKSNIQRLQKMNKDNHEDCLPSV